MMDRTAFKETFKKGDIFVVDAGFRDCRQKLIDNRYQVYINQTLKKNQNQVDDLDSNYNRKVAKVRYVVEVLHGVLKNAYPRFKHQLRNKGLLNSSTDWRILCSIYNLHFKMMGLKMK